MSSEQINVTDCTEEISPLHNHVRTGGDDWGDEREGYVDLPQTTTCIPVRQPASEPRDQGHSLTILAEERVASLIAAAGAIWTTYTATVDYAGLWQFHLLPPGPLEVCSLGVLAWLHAKWRRSTITG